MLIPRSPLKILKEISSDHGAWNVKPDSYTNNPGFGELVMLSGFFGVGWFYYGWSHSRTTLEKDIVTTLSVSTMLLGEE